MVQGFIVGYLDEIFRYDINSVYYITPYLDQSLAVLLFMSSGMSFDMRVIFAEGLFSLLISSKD